MGPMQVESLGRKRYVLVIFDDYSRYTWIRFIRENLDTFKVVQSLCLQIQREKDQILCRIRSDHGKECENSLFFKFSQSEGIFHEFFAPITPKKIEL